MPVVIMPVVPRLLNRTSFTLVLLASFCAAALAIFMCVLGLSNLRGNVAGISETTRIEQQAGDVLGLVNQSLVAFTAVTLDDLSPQERVQILASTEQAFTTMEYAVAYIWQIAVRNLPAQRQMAFADASASISHSWQELRDQSLHGLTATEKSYHFLRILDDIKTMKDILTSIQQNAASATDHNTRSAFDSIARNISLILYVIAAGAVFVGFGALLVRSYISQLTHTNAELAARNQALVTANHAAEAASRAKSAFMATVSHELRTPLNAIVGFSDLLRRAALGPLGNTEYKEYAEHISTGGSHLASLINDILDFSKAEAGELRLNEGPVNLSAVLSRTTILFSQRCDVAGITLRLDVAKAPRLYGDERRIRQILLNLLSNAVKFTPQGGTITVFAGMEGDTPMLTVRDTGIGIAAADLAKALAPFGQIENHMTRRHEGTGLGLPLVKTMAELHGGSFALKSQPGEGTTATIIFPAARAIRSQAPVMEVIPALARAA